ncbi:MAG: hypothetical protein ACTSVI_11195 [Promethearchaeota archaeon]
MTTPDNEKSILDFMLEARPTTIEDLISGFEKQHGNNGPRMIKLVKELVKKGMIPVVDQEMSGKNKRPVFTIINDVISKLANTCFKDAVFRSIIVIILVDVFSWVLLVSFLGNANAKILNTLILGLNFLFIPGFSFCVAWYPLRNSFTEKYNDMMFMRNDQEGENQKGKKSEPINALSLIALSIVYSLAMIIIIAYLLGLLSLGINLFLINAFFNFLEALSILNLALKYKKFKDPYGGL